MATESDCYICGKPKAEQGERWCSYPHARIPIAPVNPEHPEGFWIWEEKPVDAESAPQAQGQ